MSRLEVKRGERGSVLIVKRKDPYGRTKRVGIRKQDMGLAEY
jgi:hypothetical protein